MHLWVGMMHLVELFARLEAEGGIAGGDEAFVGVGVQVGHKLLEHGGRHAVVVRGPGEVFAASFAKSSVQRTREFEVVLVVDDADTTIGIGIPLHYLQRVVRRAVVDDDEFPVGKGLADNTLDGLCQETCAVIAGEDDGDGGKHDVSYSL